MRANATTFLVFVAAVTFARPAPGEAPARAITLRECVEAALRNNVDIAISRGEREIGALGIPIEESAFLPKLTGELSYERDHLAGSSAITGTLAIDQELYKANVGATDLLRTGTLLTLAFQNQRQ